MSAPPRVEHPRARRPAGPGPRWRQRGARGRSTARAPAPTVGCLRSSRLEPSRPAPLRRSRRSPVDHVKEAHPAELDELGLVSMEHVLAGLVTAIAELEK